MLLSCGAGALCCLTLAAAPADDARFHPPGMRAWDFWYAQHEGVYHAFFLQAPDCAPEPREVPGVPHVGHASSADLVHWTNHGPCLVPQGGTWNDLAIATGSVVRHDGRWWMLFSGRGSRQSGIGLAVSDDLFAWEKVGDGPVVSFGDTFDGEWQGEPLRWRGLADPYVYPEAVDGWYYLALNSRVEGAPISESGCLTMMRSRDLVAWEPHSVMAWPRLWERLETPQVWPHDERWYVVFGGAHDHGLPEGYLAQVPPEVQALKTRGNYVYAADKLAGPYGPVGRWWLLLPDGLWHYIPKVIEGPDGREVLLTMSGYKLSKPYPVSYAEDGSVELAMP